MRLLTNPFSLCLLGVSLLPGLHASVIQVAAPGGFTNATLVETFEDSSQNGPGYTFEASDVIISAAAATGGVTPSGSFGLRDNSTGPIRVALSSDTFEIGAWFGNDDFNFSFQAILEIFDAANNSLGSVTVDANRNDFADQFIGLRSDTAFRAAEFRYQRPEANQLSVYIDDLYLGNADAGVPEPGSIALMALGLGALVALRRSTH